MNENGAGDFEVSPASGVPKIAYQKQTRNALKLDEVEKILDLQYWDGLNAWRAAKTAELTGMRAGEIRRLLWEEVDHPRGRISVYNNRPAHLAHDKAPKWGKARVTIYPAQLRELLEPLRQPKGYVFGDESKPLSYEVLSGALERACKKAKVRATLHQLRHSLNTYLRGAGVPDDMLRGMFGWSAPSTQEGYTHRELYDLTPLENAVSNLK